jgi:methylglyoxal synthase
MAMSMVLNKAIKKSKKDSSAMLRQIAKDIYPVKDMLCIQDTAYDKDSDDEDEDDDGYAMHQSTALDFDFLLDENGDFLEEDGSTTNFEEPANTFDPDFEPAFPASDMRCLALVSHNGMKKTMREFVTANKNLLKKFRLTGTNSTMTMLKEVFADEPDGTVVFGPACASGPLGGDAELVAYMVSGKIGGIIFFQDPMDSHPHRADIDCLVRQALVHNVVMAETPSSALMIAQCLRSALVGKGKPELIPSFFFSLQSPTVEAYKNQQKNVVDIQKAEAARFNSRMSTMY